MSDLYVRNWDKWQSYRKDRGVPPWIKVHRVVLSNPEWSMLSDAEKGQLVSLWILAASKSGKLPSDEAVLMKLCMLENAPNIEKFIEFGFLERAGCQDDANVTSERRQNDAKVTPKRRQDDAKVTPKRRQDVTPEKNREEENREETEKKRTCANQVCADQSSVASHTSTASDKKYMELAESLKRVVLLRRNRIIPDRHVVSWAKEIRRMVKIDKITPAQIETAINWYERHWMDDYVPEIESAKSLREKWASLLRAIDRAQPKKTHNSSNADVLDPEYWKKQGVK
ncbi:MAG: hypothetical protein IH612_06955 [Desulfofustis sp.]|nr:hypothetical protein [Desulfofustis sp.]